MQRQTIWVLWGLLAILAACEGKKGSSLSVQVKKGTILNRNYTDGNPRFASIHLGQQGSEPTVLFFGIENENGVYNKVDYTSVIWADSDSEYSVPGTGGWYLLVNDRRKNLVSSNYQVKFIQ